MLRLRDDQWERIREHFPEEHIPEGRPGRKPVPARAILEAVLWILNTGAQRKTKGSDPFVFSWKHFRQSKLD